MTLSDARAALKLDTDAASEPVVTDAELDTILGQVALVDSAGLAPSDDDWVGTYELNLAAAKVFDVKVSRVATHFDFSADGSKFNRSQKVQHFKDMAAERRRRINYSLGEDLEMESDAV